MVRLLVFTPTFGDGPHPETIDSVAAQTFDGELTHEISWHNPYPTQGRDMRNVTAQYQRAHQMTIDGGYDALLTVEHDMRLPEKAAQALWDTPAPVVYATYLLRHGNSKVLNLWQWTGGKNLGMSLSIYPQELRRYVRQGWGRVCGVGYGCTLIRREVLQAIPFREDGEGNACDLPFAMDCIRAGYMAIGRLDTLCDHYHEGTWLRVFERGVGMIVRVLALQNVTVDVDGASTPMVKGRYYSVSTEQGQELQRAGYVMVQVQRETEDAPPIMETADSPVQKRHPKSSKNAAP